MKAPEWVLHETVLALHEQLLAQFGGLSGVRDVGLLESALARPRQLLAYGNPTLASLAAAYVDGLVRNHPFLDGNKRVAFVTAVVFLELNGLRFTASEAEAVVQTLGLAAREIKPAAYTLWLAANVEPA